MKVKKQSMWKRCVFLGLGLGLFIGTLPVKAEAAWEAVTLEQVQMLAFSNSSAYKKLESEMLLLQAEYSDALKSVWLKQKDMLTFRWSPLLDFQFPEWPDQADLYDWQYKPIQIQTEIQTLLHKMKDMKYEVIENASLLYTELYIQQEKISFVKKRLDSLSEIISRNEWKLKTGSASQAEVDKLYSSEETLTKELSLLKREAQQNGKKLSEMTGLEKTGFSGEIGFQLENPLVSAEIGRELLEPLKEHTLKNNQTYYEAKMNTKLGKKSLEINEKLLKKQYGGKAQSLQIFLNQAKQGMELDGAAFKTAYDSFLTEIDEPWNGHIRILFLKIPKEWFKGALSGVRFIQDDPYVLYTAALEYTDLVKAEEEVRKEVISQVEDGFEALVSAKNAYRTLQSTVAKEKKALQKDTVRNQKGLLTMEELRSAQESYEALQTDELDALSEYSRLLYSFDRLTCGGVSAYLNGEELDTEAASGGVSYLSQTLQGQASYYIQPVVEEQMFLFGITIPDGFSPEITSFELWVNGTQIGSRTPVSEPLGHLTLALNGINTAVVRLYRGDEPVAECEIETLVSSAPLEIPK